MPDKKPFADPNTKEAERAAPQNSAEAQTPFLGIVPIPTLSVDRVDIGFELDVKPRADGTAGQDAGKGGEITFSQGPFSAAVSGYITVKPSAPDIPAIDPAPQTDEED